MSIPIALLPRIFDSTKIVPLPIKLSKIRSFFLDSFDIR